MFLPMASRNGLARSKLAASPPTIKLRVPAVAPLTPPDTGASTNKISAAAAAAPTSCAVATSIVLESTTRVPAGICASKPSGPVYKPATCLPAGNMLTTTSAPCTAARAESAVLPPACSKVAKASGIKSNAVTLWPAFTRLAAIGPPMLPRPINAIFVMLILRCLTIIKHSQAERCPADYKNCLPTL